jgi:hypothetical protein
MTRSSAGWILTLLLGHAVAIAGTGSEVAPGEPVSSTKERGTVSVLADPALADGRLVLKVVAFNRTKEAVSFGPDSVVISTASGQRVALLSLEQLVKEARAAGGRAGRADHNPANYSGAGISQNSAGQPDVGNYTGSHTPIGGGVSPHTQAATPSGGTEDASLQQQIANLEAAVLHPLTIAPGAAAGGQVVTEKLKLKRKDDRTLLIAVDLSGEHHEIRLIAPR